jgi:hypothetical protein
MNTYDIFIEFFSSSLNDWWSLYDTAVVVMNCVVAERYSTAVLQYPRYCSRGGGLRGRAARVAEALGTLAAGLRPRPAREKGFPSNLLLD